MNQLVSLLREFKQGLLAEEDVTSRIQNLTVSPIGMGFLDAARPCRKGFPEVVYAPGKNIEDIILALIGLEKSEQLAVASRVADSQVEVLIREFDENSRWDPISRLFIANCGRIPSRKFHTSVAVVSAGLADRRVSEEVSILLEIVGYPVARVNDVGVAGLQRLLLKMDELMDVEVIVAVAGMEGALPSVLAGLLPQPVIAVPSSNGYGVGEGGLAALLALLNSCAPGLTVVNIDNGYGAAMMAHAICSRIHKNSKNTSL